MCAQVLGAANVKKFMYVQQSNMEIYNQEEEKHGFYYREYRVQCIGMRSSSEGGLAAITVRK